MAPRHDRPHHPRRSKQRAPTTTARTRTSSTPKSGAARTSTSLVRVTRGSDRSREPTNSGSNDRQVGRARARRPSAGSRKRVLRCGSRCDRDAEVSGRRAQPLGGGEHRARVDLNEERGLSDRITVMDGSFEAIDMPDGSFDVVWSQDAILHAGDRARVLAEVTRVLRPGGQFVFTDPMQSDDCDHERLQADPGPDSSPRPGLAGILPGTGESTGTRGALVRAPYRAPRDPLHPRARGNQAAFRGPRVTDKPRVPQAHDRGSSALDRWWRPVRSGLGHLPFRQRASEGRVEGPKPARPGLHRTVFFTSAALILGSVALSLVAGQSVGGFFTLLQTAIVQRVGWLYVLAMTGFVGFASLAAFFTLRRHPARRRRRPAGVLHPHLVRDVVLRGDGHRVALLQRRRADYPLREPAQRQRGRRWTPRGKRWGLTLFHWCLHPWSVYAIVGLSLAYFSFRRGLPLSVRSMLHPLLGDRIHGRLGDAVDILAIVSTMFGGSRLPWGSERLR